MPTLDVRSKRGRRQIRGALYYDPKALLTEERLMLPLPHDGRVVIYGDDEQQAEQIAARLHEQGYHNVAVLEGGFEAYEDAGLATEELTEEQPVPGQERTGIPRL